MAYNAANGNEDLDLLLMLGDNAYLDGSDKQYQAAQQQLQNLCQTPARLALQQQIDTGPGDATVEPH